MKNQTMVSTKTTLLLLLSVSVMCAGQLVSAAEVHLELPPVTKVNTPSASDIINFTKRLYSALGKTIVVNDVVVNFKGEYETLNYDGKLADKLSALYDMRLEDLEISVQHAKKMKDLLAALSSDHVAEEVPKVEKPSDEAMTKPTPQEAQATLVSSLKP